MSVNEFKTLSDKKRYYIVKAASELFLNKGYGSVSMDEIAGRAKVSKRTVYNHFSAKEVLFAEVANHTWACLEPPEIGDYINKDVGEALKEFAYRMLKVLRSEKYTKLLRLVMGESGRFPELSELYAKHSIRPFLRTLEEYFSIKADSGELNIKDPALAAQQYLGIVKESLFWPVILSVLPMPTPERDTHVIETSVQILLDMYKN